MSCTFNADFFLRIFFFYLYDKNIMFFFFKSVPVSLNFVENPSRSLNWRKIDLSSCTKFELLYIPQKINLYSANVFFSKSYLSLKFKLHGNFAYQHVIAAKMFLKKYGSYCFKQNCRSPFLFDVCKFRWVQFFKCSKQVYNR